MGGIESNTSDPITSSLLESDPDCVDIVGKYVSFLPGRLEKIYLVIVEDDITEFKDLIHDLKGVSGGMGYPQVSDLCQTIEIALQDNDMKLVLDKIHELENLKNRIEAGFR